MRKRLRKAKKLLKRIAPGVKFSLQERKGASKTGYMAETNFNIIFVPKSGKLSTFALSHEMGHIINRDIHDRAFLAGSQILAIEARASRTGIKLLKKAGIPPLKNGDKHLLKVVHKSNMEYSKNHVSSVAASPMSMAVADLNWAISVLKSNLIWREM